MRLPQTFSRPKGSWRESRIWSREATTWEDIRAMWCLFHVTKRPQKTYFVPSADLVVLPVIVSEGPYSVLNFTFTALVKQLGVCWSSPPERSDLHWGAEGKTPHVPGALGPVLVSLSREHTCEHQQNNKLIRSRWPSVCTEENQTKTWKQTADIKFGCKQQQEIQPLWMERNIWCTRNLSSVAMLFTMYLVLQWIPRLNTKSAVSAQRSKLFCSLQQSSCVQVFRFFWDLKLGSSLGTKKISPPT